VLRRGWVSSPRDLLSTPFLPLFVSFCVLLLCLDPHSLECPPSPSDDRLPTPLRSGMRILLTPLNTLSCRFSSATPSLEVALQYAGKRHSSLFEIVTGGIDRGAHLSWLSQFPAEGGMGSTNLLICACV